MNVRRGLVTGIIRGTGKCSSLSLSLLKQQALKTYSGMEEQLSTVS
jgi:hypothetical protein